MNNVGHDYTDPSQINALYCGLVLGFLYQWTSQFFSLASKSITTSLYIIMSSASHWKLDIMTWILNTIRSQVFEIVAIWLQPCCYCMCISLWTTFQWNDHLVLLFIRQYNSLISHWNPWVVEQRVYDNCQPAQYRPKLICLWEIWMTV